MTNFKIWEPFTDVDDAIEDFVDDVDDTMRRVKKCSHLKQRLSTNCHNGSN
ncbi:MAG: hypothetical protein AAGD09_08985 [Cyanobacteria bacterium P01_F01_bin.56]